MEVERKNENINKLKKLLEERDKLLEEVQNQQDITEIELRQKNQEIIKIKDENCLFMDNLRLRIKKRSFDDNNTDENLIESYCRSSRIDESLQATNQNEHLLFQFSEFDDEKKLSSLTDYQMSCEKDSLIENMKKFIDKKLSEVISFCSKLTIRGDIFRLSLKISCKTVSDGKEEVEAWFKRIESDFRQLMNFVGELKDALDRLTDKVCQKNIFFHLIHILKNFFF